MDFKTENVKTITPVITNGDFIDSNNINFSEFFMLMDLKISEHKQNYGDTWKTMSLGKLNDRLKAKYNEFDLTFNKDKLISIANLAMLLYIRMKEDKNG